MRVVVDTSVWISAALTVHRFLTALEAADRPAERDRGTAQTVGIEREAASSVALALSSDHRD
jgi:hypothetical protein